MYERREHLHGLGLMVQTLLENRSSNDNLLKPIRTSLEVDRTHSNFAKRHSARAQTHPDAGRLGYDSLKLP